MSSSVGWETKSPEEALARHFMYWFASRRDQGKVAGSVPSFYYLWATHGTTPETMLERTKSEFDNYIKELFPQSEVSVTKEIVDGQANNYHLLLSAKSLVDGVVYDLSRAVLVTGELYKVLDEKRLG
jgi:hypothetical protein